MAASDDGHGSCAPRIHGSVHPPDPMASLLVRTYIRTQGPLDSIDVNAWDDTQTRTSSSYGSQVSGL
jgi:hypothetical protein